MQSQKRKPGRPREGTDLRDTILDLAEQFFAEHGFNGASLRDIAGAAQVNQAMIRYYFGTKDALFDEVFRRRGSTLSGRRQALLDKLLAEGSPTVEEIVHAYLKPQWDMKYSGPGGAAFVRLQARLHAEPEEHALRLRREVYDESVKRYVSALEGALPGLDRDTISIRMSFVVGAYMFMLNDLGRLGDLTDGHVVDMGKEQMMNHLVRFLSAGLRA